MMRGIGEIIIAGGGRGVHEEAQTKKTSEKTNKGKGKAKGK